MIIHHCPKKENTLADQSVTIVELTRPEALQLALDLLRQIVDFPNCSRKEFFSPDNEAYFSVQVEPERGRERDSPFFPLQKRRGKKARRTR